jgi:hypothetical protein
MSSADILVMLAYTRQQRASSEPFEAVAVGWVYGHSKEAGDTLLADYADAGVTCWLEGFTPGDTVADVRARIRAATATGLMSEALMIAPWDHQSPVSPSTMGTRDGGRLLKTRVAAFLMPEGTIIPRVSGWVIHR